MAFELLNPEYYKTKEVNFLFSKEENSPERMVGVLEFNILDKLSLKVNDFKGYIFSDMSKRIGVVFRTFDRQKRKFKDIVLIGDNYMTDNDYFLMKSTLLSETYFIIIHQGKYLLELSRVAEFKETLNQK